MDKKNSCRRNFYIGILLLACSLLGGCGNQNDSSYQPEGQLGEELSVLEKEQLASHKGNESIQPDEGNSERIGEE